MTEQFQTYVSVQRRGVIALPPEVRKRLRLDEPGAQLQLTEREEGVFELRGYVPIPSDQAWFWTERWQQMEREADEDIAAGRVRYADNVEDFLAQLER
jgi:bifunctional DNA-binding transcriptional regulator/antitoxin component of YhaV-PrlF toxin-antitoxin module